MAGQFEGKVAFVTGASAGIGAGVAEELARQGAKVALAARRPEKLDDIKKRILAAGGEALAVACDVTDRASLDAAAQEAAKTFGGIDLVLANAGVGVMGPAHKLETEDFRRQFATNVFGALDTLYATLPYLQESSDARIGFVGSVMGRLGMPVGGPYCASKFAVVGLAESIYFDLKKIGIAVTLINPGLVASELRSINNQGEHTGKPDPAPQFLVMPTEKAARQIVRAMYRRKPEVVITGHGKAAIFMARHFPRTTRAAMNLMSASGANKLEKERRENRV